jgi:hypothetical protein
VSAGFNGQVTWRASDELTVRKTGHSVHLTVSFSVAISQRLLGCLGLFIHPPLTHLRWLDCVEVQRSARHLEDHIQAIQVLIKFLIHRLADAMCVCLVLGLA